MNICVENRGGRSYMLNFSKQDAYDNFKNTIYIESQFLESTHDIYSLDFSLEIKHSAYNK